ncbi:MAG: M15 family metallopeptidase [Lachnospiraceae bacterium]|nr:M15 family metallopeptidase [Lachnospiraceae bacterium]
MTLNTEENKVIKIRENTENDRESDREKGLEKPVPETVSGPEVVIDTDKEEDFYISGINDEIFSRIEGRSFAADCILKREDLRYLHVLHKDINGVTHEGEIIVNKKIASDVLEIFKVLYENNYPIEKIRLIDEYNADDEASMEDNNSSGFNFRFIQGTDKISKHGMGMAVDINPLYNPYVKEKDGNRIIEPINAEPYTDREKQFDYKIEKGDLCYEQFIEHGFIWGGEWKSVKDYQHFEIPD